MNNRFIILFVDTSKAPLKRWDGAWCMLAALGRDLKVWYK